MATMLLLRNNVALAVLLQGSKRMNTFNAALKATLKVYLLKKYLIIFLNQHLRSYSRKQCSFRIWYSNNVAILRINAGISLV